MATKSEFIKRTTTAPCNQTAEFFKYSGLVNVVDTPGFTYGTENRTLDKIIEYLRDEVPLVSTFAILWSAFEYPEITDEQIRMLRVLKKGFKNNFWDNVVFIVTKWSIHTSWQKTRAERGQTQEVMTKMINSKVNEILNMNREFKVYYLDTFFNRHAYEEDYRFHVETIGFRLKMNATTPYVCKYLDTTADITKRNNPSTNSTNEKSILDKIMQLSIFEIILIGIGAAFPVILLSLCILNYTNCFGFSKQSVKVDPKASVPMIRIRDDHFDAHYM